MNFYIFQNEQVLGPFLKEDVISMRKEGKLDGDTLVRSDQNEEWVRADVLLVVDENQSVPSSVGNVQSSKDVKSYKKLLDVKKQASDVLSDLRAMNFRDEIAPLNAQTFAILKKDFVFWAVILLGVFPTLLVTLNSSEAQLVGFLLFFAAIWGVIFKNFIINETSGWRLPLGALFFTGIVGIPIYLVVMSLLPEFYLKLPYSENFLMRLLGSILTTGASEELLKIIPALGYIAWKRRKATPLTIITLGVFSGLGFAAFENIDYAGRAIVTAIGLTLNHGAVGLGEGVTDAMVNVMLRSMSLVFAHATFSGIFSYFVTIGFITKRRRMALGLVGLALAATAHGLYNFLWSVQDLMPSVITALSFILFYSYLTKLRVITEVDREAEPVISQASL